jgi:hypothetical protein
MSMLRRARKSAVGVFRRTRKSYLDWRSRPVLRELGILDHFEGYPPQAIPPQYANLLGLYRLTLQRKPAVVLELGGGCSTFAFAHAVRELRSGGWGVEFHSVDESDYWQQVVKDRLPSELSALVHFWRATPKLVNFSGEEVSAFDSLPVQSANLVYVDGGLVAGSTIGGDAALLEAKAPADYAILVDKRKETVAFLRRMLKGKYHFGVGAMGTQTLLTRV